MVLNDIKKIAELHGIKAGKMKKCDLVRAIQSAEGSDSCYETGRAMTCGQSACLWRDDCLKQCK